MPSCGQAPPTPLQLFPEPASPFAVLVVHYITQNSKFKTQNLTCPRSPYPTVALSRVCFLDLAFLRGTLESVGAIAFPRQILFLNKIVVLECAGPRKLSYWRDRRLKNYTEIIKKT